MYGVPQLDTPRVGQPFTTIRLYKAPDRPRTRRRMTGSHQTVNREWFPQITKVPDHGIVDELVLHTFWTVEQLVVRDELRL